MNAGRKSVSVVAVSEASITSGGPLIGVIDGEVEGEVLIDGVMDEDSEIEGVMEIDSEIVGVLDREENLEGVIEGVLVRLSDNVELGVRDIVGEGVTDLSGVALIEWLAVRDKLFVGVRELEAEGGAITVFKFDTVAAETTRGSPSDLNPLFTATVSALSFWSNDLPMVAYAEL
jgi:hypothetical protein